MIYIQNDNGRVGLIHYMPFDATHGLGKTTEELEQEGMLVDSIPESLRIEGKEAIMYINVEKKEIYYEYEDIPETKEDLSNKKIQELEQQLLGLQEYIINKEAEELLNQGGM